MQIFKTLKPYVSFIAILSIVLVFTACSLQTPKSEMANQSVASIEPTVVQATETPSYRFAPADAIAADYDEVSFWFSPAVARSWKAEYVPQGPGSSSSAGPVSHTDPEHIIFKLNDYVAPSQSTADILQPRIYIYPAVEMSEQNQGAGIQIQALQAYLATPPADLMDLSAEIPFLPLVNGAQVLHTQVKFLDFQNGSGVRFITSIAQGFVPIGNGAIFYTYQGLTSDGAYYVAVLMPVTNPILDGGPPDNFMDDPISYVQGIAEQLDRQPSSSYTPDLSSLDAIIETLLVRP